MTLCISRRLASGLLALSWMGTQALGGTLRFCAGPDVLPALRAEILLPAVERPFTAGPDSGIATLVTFLDRHEGEVVLLDLRVRSGEAAAGACRGNLAAVEPGEVLLRLPPNLLVIIEPLVRGAPFAFCHETRDGWRLSAFVFIEPPPEVASLRSWTLHPVVVDALLANRTRRCLDRAGTDGRKAGRGGP